MKLKKIIISFLAVCLCFSSFFAMATNLKNELSPIAENIELSTFRNVSVEGTLKATSPQNTELEYVVTTPSMKGEVCLLEDGSFVYEPREGQKGSDYFGYKAVDSKGNESNEATVIIKILKQKGKVCYSDLKGQPCAYAATFLAENEIFVGEKIGDSYVFNPETQVSRMEFLSLCMEISNMDLLEGIKKTGFGDDENIPEFMKPYVSTALLSGIISGYSEGYDTAVFKGEQTITQSEAAVMLNRSLNLNNVSVANLTDILPVWSVQAWANLDACEISSVATVNAEKPLTRGDCALMLVGAMELLENR